MPLDSKETGFLFDEPLICLYVPGSGRRLEVIGPLAADAIATLIHDHWIDTLAIRVVHTDPFHEGEGTGP